MPEPRLRDEQAGEADALKMLNDAIDSLAPADAGDADREAIVQILWSLQTEAAAIENADRQIERLRAEIWEPFERCATRA